MANNKNPRRTIWLSETEPLSHYDIWLSKNQHLNSEGDPVSDNGVLRPCDYIFKVWDCDNWYPIIGLNATAVNKIDTVYNQGYQSTNPNTGHTIDSFSYLEFHLPLFTKPECSPAELFDAGTIGEAILEYVTELEWLHIFEGDAFSNAFEDYLEGDNININNYIEPAGFEYLGGIWADRFTQSYDGDEYLAQCKYKYQPNSTRLDYNLYVHAKDIYKAISEYIEDNDVDVDIINSLFNIFENSASIIKGWHQLPENAPTQQIQANKPRFVIGGDPWTQVGNRGKFLKSRDDDGWYDLHGGADYSVNNSCWEYVDIRDITGGADPTPSSQRTIKGLYGINATYRTFSDSTEGYALKLSGYDSNTPNQMYCRTTTYTIPDNNRDQVPNEWLYADEHGSTNRGLEWISGPDMIKEETNYDEGGMGSKKVYLSCDHNTFKWDEELGVYAPGYGIDFNNDDTDTEINLNISEVSVASSSIPGGSVLSIKWDGESDNNILLDKYITQGEDITLKKIFIYEYLKLSGYITLTINLIAENKLPFFNPNPIYIYADNISKFYIEAGNNIIDDENLILTGGEVPVGLYLITIQFGTIKIEQIKTVTSNNQ